MVQMSMRVRKVGAGIVAAIALAGMATGGAGCADALVYAKDARKSGMDLYSQGDYADAAGSFISATRQDPQDYQSYYYLGASYTQLRDYREAVSAFHTSLSVMPLTLQGQHDAAFHDRTLDALATAISRSPSVSSETSALEKQNAQNPSAENTWLLAKIYRYTGDADAAVDAYNKAVLIGMDNFALVKEAGLYEQTLGQTERAAIALRQAHALKPDDPQVADALQRMGGSPSGGGDSSVVQIPAPTAPASLNAAQPAAASQMPQ